ncbi:hypothetical protein QQP08_003576 [Theobroma cacao]|nr:hypothetical protein QQP08_003576 [Theobroma cacao]
MKREATHFYKTFICLCGPFQEFNLQIFILKSQVLTVEYMATPREYRIEIPSMTLLKSLHSNHNPTFLNREAWKQHKKTR